ncbi:uncharacterized protein LOC119672520 [Teleopsis dalmanni]|uniref:uncharacterized protein LOC119672520 n=1 Tax=Teleopsis dalmanni TaxID=139649 RepID=UPI0018CE6E0F|nr:uncharacterized protein LOC119672520 [Teleopsis dalmanni]
MRKRLLYEDVYEHEKKYYEEKANNANFKPAAQLQYMKNPTQTSLFAKNRKKPVSANDEIKNEFMSKKDLIGDIQEKTIPEIAKTKEMLCGIRENTVTDYANKKTQNNLENVLLKDIVERPSVPPNLPNVHTKTPTPVALPFPTVVSAPANSQTGKSLFAIAMDRRAVKLEAPTVSTSTDIKTEEPMDCIPIEHSNRPAEKSIEDMKIEVHSENLKLITDMDDDKIMEERRQLLKDLDPSTIEFIKNMRKRKTSAITKVENNPISESKDIQDTNPTTTTPTLSLLPDECPAVELLEQSTAENWINFDVIEKEKLEWMREIPMKAAKLKSGEKFEARFDFAGVLLPYSLNETVNTDNQQPYERELYLHTEDPHRPGYALQELFRLARSFLVPQRIYGYKAIAGILRLYNQGFYDQVLQLPLSKIFFLLRLGLDDLQPALTEVVSKGLAYLFYNEIDEALLDYIYDNPYCYWQPTLQVISTEVSEETDSVEDLQKQMQQLQVKQAYGDKHTTIDANIEETEQESKTSMSDFHLAEVDLVDCLLRSNILQRIYFILQKQRPENSAVISCLKLLIRLARTDNEIAIRIVNNDNLLRCLFDNFLPSLENVDTMTRTPTYYNYPQHLVLKLIRVLISQSLPIAIKFVNLNIVDKLLNYICSCDDIRGALVHVQTESLRVLRCLLLLNVDNGQFYKKFLHAFRYMLHWHFNHVTYEEGGSFLIRQHATALLATITSGPSNQEAHDVLSETLLNCCCKWFHRATIHGIKEFTQATLLSACLNAVTWYCRASSSVRFRTFLDKYLPDFVASKSFMELILSLRHSSIILRSSTDRRWVHPPLPNVGAVVMNSYGPQLILSQQYSIYLLTTLWRLIELQFKHNDKSVYNVIFKPAIMEPLVEYMKAFMTKTNQFLATNFFAKIEIKFICKLLAFEGIDTYLTKQEMMLIAYNLCCCLTADHIEEIEELFEKVIFNSAYHNVDPELLNKWRQFYLELVYPHYIFVSSTELTLSMRASQPQILNTDWPYHPLKRILKYALNMQTVKPTAFPSEISTIINTLSFIDNLEKFYPNIHIVSPTEKLLYLMITFLGPQCEFNDHEVKEVQRMHILRLYEQCKDYNFQFETKFKDKCKFENLYLIFVDHFSAVSNGNELFTSLLFVPLAQKYDKKYRCRVWSDNLSALVFANCDENMLLGGLNAYVEPHDKDESLLDSYMFAIRTQAIRRGTIPFKIAVRQLRKAKKI